MASVWSKDELKTEIIIIITDLLSYAKSLFGDLLHLSASGNHKRL